MGAAEVAGVVLGHLAKHRLPEPSSLNLTLFGGREVRVQVRADGLADTAGVLLAWARTFPAVTLRAWCPPSGDRVHLDVDTTLIGAAGAVALTVYGGVPFYPAVFPGLEPGLERPVSLGELAGWARVRV